MIKLNLDNLKAI